MGLTGGLATGLARGLSRPMLSGLTGNGMGPSAGTPPTIAFVGAGAVANPGTSTTTQPTKACTAGNLVLALVGNGGGIAYSGPGGGWTNLLTLDNTGVPHCELWYLTGNNNPGGTLSPIFTSASVSTVGFLAEISGANPSSPVEQTASNVTTGATTTCASGTIAGGGATSIAIAVFCQRITGSATVVFTPGGSFTNAQNSGSLNKVSHITMDYLLNCGATPSETQTSGTVAATNGWAAGIATFHV